MKLHFRPISAGVLGDIFGGSGWPEWVRITRGKSGVYVIRNTGGNILYVGESHTGRLYQTLTRHFQSWSGRTAGPTYGRGSVEISLHVIKAARAVSVQNDLIARLQPRDNTLSPAGPLNDDPF